MDQIQINGNARAPASDDGPAAAPSTSTSSSMRRMMASEFLPASDHPKDDIGTNHILVQVTGPLEAEQKQALDEKKVNILEYVGHDVYLCGYEPPSLEPLKALSDFVVDAEVYHPYYVVEPGLQSKDDDEETPVTINLHDDIDHDNFGGILEEIAKRASDTTGYSVSASDLKVNDKKIQLAVPKATLAPLAAIDQVKTINEEVETKLCNNVATKIMHCHQPIGLNHAVYKGEGELVCVADTGFDTGDPNKCHEAFGPGTGRVVAVSSVAGRTENNDPEGHGTHVCGSVIGNGKHTDQGVIEAPASLAKLVVQSTFAGWDKSEDEHRDNRDPSKWQPWKWGAILGGTGDPAGLFQKAVDQKAMIHTNSWGSRSPGPYESATAGPIDKFIRDNQMLVVLFSAGNSGRDADSHPGIVDPSSLSRQANSKNCITVGASESYRPEVRYPTAGTAKEGKPLVWGAWKRDFAYDPITNDDVANNIEGMAAWSSRGPTSPGNRIKPDVVGPGTTILSTRSSQIQDRYFDAFWGESTDPKWSYSGGTSMATPLVTSVCAVIRGALVKDGTVTKDPSAALIKAILINGAVPLKGQYGSLYGTKLSNGTVYPHGEFDLERLNDVPNFSTGFGRVNLHNSLQHVVADDSTKGVIAGLVDAHGCHSLGKDNTHPKEHSFTIQVPNSTASQTLKVTLVWNDPAGEYLQNDLDLIVASPDNKDSEKHGNVPDGSADFDRENNVEQVRWRDVKAGGVYTVTVKAYRTTIDPQPYAVAWRVFPTPT